LGRALEEGAADPPDIAHFLETWRAYNEELLRFYHLNRDRALLVNAEAVLENPSEFLSACSTRFGLSLVRINRPVLTNENVGALALWSASVLLNEVSQIGSLFEELESAADLPCLASAKPDGLAERALTQDRELQAELAKARTGREDLRTQRDEQRRANRVLQSQLHQAQEELRRALNALDEEKERTQAESDQTGALRSKLDDEGKQNELLVLQLRQMQEELERIFLDAKETEASRDRIQTTLDDESKRNGLLVLQLQQVQADLDRVRLEAQKARQKNRILPELERRLHVRDAALAAARYRESMLKSNLKRSEATRDRIQKSVSWRISAPLRGIGRALARIGIVGSERIREDARIHREMRLVAESGFFDRAWYLAVYKDVAEAGTDPLLHFVMYGAREGRSPGPRFDAKLYLSHYNDVASMGVNPLVHYLEIGRAEGRLIGALSDARKLPNAPSDKPV
jgi:hypothetical protein